MMDIKKVWAVYFSATGTTKRVAAAIAREIAQETETEYGTFDFTLPSAREDGLCFGKGDVVVFGTPVYAGRVPNVLLKYLATVKGNGALAVPVVLFGNRDFDDALIELRDILTADGFLPVAGAAFVGEHAFSYVLAAGRPDDQDMQKAREFGRLAAAKLSEAQAGDTLKALRVDGTEKPYRGYFQPRDRAGKPIDIRKAKPLTGEACDDCKLCADICPMGSISHEDVREITGICIKCGACVKRCPKKAKYLDDAGYLYHKTELEEGLLRRAEPKVFL